MKCAKWAMILLNTLILCSCANIQARPVNSKSYTLGAIEQANMGSPILTNYQSTFAVWLVDEDEHWIGLANFPKGCKHVHYVTDESFIEELIFTGHNSDTINISYRNFKKDIGISPLNKELRYDLSKSNRIVFKQYKMEVIEATNEYIKFIVTAD